MTGSTEYDQRHELWASDGWHVVDDDVPHPPEADPLSSAQSRRAWRESLADQAAS
jgi:hypothetical protein